MNDTASKTDSHETPKPDSPEETAAQASAQPEKETPAATEPAAAENAEAAPEEAAAPEETAPPEPSLQEQLAAARAEASAAKEAHLRAVADLENFRRRTAREKDDLRAYAAASVVEELMPVLDNLGFALTAAKAPNAELKPLKEGVEMVANQFKTALGNHGLKEVNPAGETFDPNLHEALSQQPSEDVDEGKVLQVIRVGYTLNGRLLRPASVIVSGGAAAADDQEKA